MLAKENFRNIEEFYLLSNEVLFELFSKPNSQLKPYDGPNALRNSL